MSNYTHGDVTAIKMPRTRFPLNQSVVTTAKVGRLYPVYLQEIYPGDTFDVNTSWVARSVVPFYRPVMDNLCVDFAYFFIPSRLCYNSWEKIFGEPNPSSWIEDGEFHAPVTVDKQVVTGRSVADYLGLPPGTVPAKINVIPFRAFALLYNNWYRDQNVIDETYVNLGDYNPEVETFNSAEWSPANYMGMPPRVSKFSDYFTNCLPRPQKGEPVQIPISGGDLPVVTTNVMHAPNNSQALRFGLTHPLKVPNDTFNIGIDVTSQSYGKRFVAHPFREPDAEIAIDSGVYPANLVAKANEVGMVTVNTLRLAFQTQKILERTARTGSRYREYIRAAFGCVTSDARMQIPEFLGGKRMPMNIQQATSTQGNTLGDVGGWSLTNGKNGYNKGFVEHGFVIGVMAIRQTKHTYSQGIERFWSRNERFDYYDPTLSHIGETPVYRSEIYAVNQDELKGDVFGYREAFSDLRYRPNYVTGQARPQQNAENYYYYTFADDFQVGGENPPPVLSEEFINETDENVIRSMSGMSDADDQFIFDLNFSGSAIRVLPAHGTPSLIDHF